MTHRQIAIVGGGLLGCSIALRLARAGRRVTLFEAAPTIGGLASAWQLGPITWDRHYHVTLMSDAHTVALLHDLGLQDALRWSQTLTGFFTQGQLYSMSNSLEFLTFPPLNLIDKARLGATILATSRMRDWRRLEHIPVTDFLIRWSGRRTFETLWRPLLRAKLGEAYTQTSAAFIWATIQRMYAARRSGMGQEQFGYLSGGYARLLSRLSDALQAANVTLRLASPVRSVAPGRRGPTVNGEPFDQVVLTAAPPVARPLVAGLGATDKALWRGLRYQGLICASLLLKRRLAPYYVTNITDDWVPFTGVIDMSALVAPDELAGHGLVYLPKYVPPTDPLFEATDTTLQRRFWAALCRMFPRLRASDLLAFRISRVRHVFPIPTPGYSRGVPPMRTSVPGLFAVSSAHIVNGTLNVNETLALAQRAVLEINA